MRLIHTADWHLGHTLHDRPRDREHARFLDWLVLQIREMEVDGLVVAGDIFDFVNPPATAQRLLYDFVARVHTENPRFGFVFIGGNHDSPTKLEAPGALLSAFRARVIGQLPWSATSPDYSATTVRLDGRDGKGAVIAAVPFLRSMDLPLIPEQKDEAVALRHVYAEAMNAARRARRSGEALVATGHLWVSGGRAAAEPERPILVGGTDSVPVDLFPDDLTYGALGHLHLAQEMPGRPNLRYSGSPLPFSFAEADYAHQVLLVELDGESEAKVTPLYVPRSVTFLCIPSGGMAAPWSEVAVAIAQLPERGAMDHDDDLPMLDVRVLVDGPEPDLGRRLTDLLHGKAARLVHHSSLRRGSDRLDRHASPLRLGEAGLGPEEVFGMRWKRVYGIEPPDECRKAFRQLLTEASAGSEEGR